MSEKIGKIEILKLSEVSNQFFVRRHLDLKRVEAFKRLYELGAKLPPLVAGVLAGDESGKRYKVDGRHREASLLELGRDKAEFETFEYATMDEMIADALERNSNAALPPTDEDNMLVIRGYVEGGLSLTAIRRLLAFMDGKSVRDYHAKVLKEIEEANMLKARRAVATGMTVTDAATEYKVDRAKLARRLSGEKGPAVPNSKYGQIKTSTSNRFKGVNAGTAKLLTKVNTMVESGELKEHEARKLYEQTAIAAMNLRAIVIESAARFNALPGIKTPIDTTTLGLK